MGRYCRKISLLFFVELVFLLVATACGTENKEKGNKAKRQTQEQKQVDLPPAFPPPSIPTTIQTPEGRANYFIEHFWDNCSFDSKELLKEKARLEQSLANLLGIVASFPSSKNIPALLYPLQHSSDSLLLYFSKQYKHYLYEPNSPFFNEELYLPIVEYLATASRVDIATKERSKFQLKLLQKNRIGKKAENFSFITSQGEKKSLNDFKGKLTVLFFFTPGCHSCESALSLLSSDIFFQNSVKKERISFLMIDAEQDYEEFLNSIKELPNLGLVGFNEDARVTEVPLYDLKASPTIYLLDQEGLVIGKDIDAASLLSYLKRTLD